MSSQTEYRTRFFNHLGAGAAFNWFNLNVDVDDSDWKGILDCKYSGPQIYLMARF